MTASRFALILLMAMVAILIYFGTTAAIDPNLDPMNTRTSRDPWIFWKSNGDPCDSSGGAYLKMYSTTYAVPADTAGHAEKPSYTETFDGFPSWYEDNFGTDIFNVFWDSAGTVQQVALNWTAQGRVLGPSQVDDSLAFATGVVTTSAILDGTLKKEDGDSAFIWARHISQNAADGVAALIEITDISNVYMTGEATGDVTYYDGTHWVNLASGDENKVLSMSSGIPAWSDVGSIAGLEMSDIAADTIGTPTYEDLEDWFNTTQASGKIFGGGFTSNGDGTVSVAAGGGIIRATDSDVADAMFFDWSIDASLALTDNETNYIYIDYDSGSSTITATITKSDANNRNKILLGKIHRVGTALICVEAGMILTELAKRTLTYITQIHGEVARAKNGGYVIGETGARYLTSTNGILLAGLTLITTIGLDTSGADTYTYYYYNGAAWVAGSASQIDNLQYNDIAAGLATLTANRYGVHWVYGDPSGAILVVYGQGDYTLIQSELAQPPSSLPGRVADIGFLAAKIIVKKSAANFYALESAYETAFTPGGAQDHGELAGLGDPDHENSGFAAGTGKHVITGSYTGLLDLNVENTSAASANVVGATVTVKNDNGYWGLMGSTCSGSTIYSSAFINTFHLYSQGYGDNLYTVDGNKSHVWYTDPTDSHNFSALTNEVMRLEPDGDLIVANGSIACWGDTSRTGASKLSVDHEDSTPGLYWHEYKSGAVTGDAVQIIWNREPYYGAARSALSLKAFCDTIGVVDFHLAGRTMGNLAPTFSDGACSTFVYVVITPGFTFDSAR